MESKRIALSISVNEKLAVEVMPDGKVIIPDGITAEDAIRAIAWTIMAGGFGGPLNDPVDFERQGLIDAVMAVWPAKENV